MIITNTPQTCMAILFREAFLCTSAMSPTAKPIYGATKCQEEDMLFYTYTSFRETLTIRFTSRIGMTTMKFTKTK